MKDLIFFFPFIINILILGLGDFWGFPEGMRGSLILLNFLGIIFLGWIYKFEWIGEKLTNGIYKKYSKISDLWLVIQNFLKKNYSYIFGLQFLLLWIFPFQNLNYGDGILLLENVYLEGKIFGYQITLDEFWEAFLHSYLFNALDLSDPRQIYLVLSSLCGFLYFAFSIYIISQYKKRNQYIDFLQVFIFLTPGTLLLFYGYAENYTIVSLILFLTLYLGRNWIQEKAGFSSIILIALLSGIGASFHLVFGYMGIALIYFTLIQSEKNQFIRNAIIASSIGLIYLGCLFGYFLFFSDPVTSPSQTHVLSPPFYPWKRLISINHLKEILGVSWFTSIFPFSVLIFAYIFKKRETQDFFGKKENRFLALSILGFYIHAFFHNPALGFPADWDLFSFYAFPLTLTVFYLVPIFGEYKKYLYPLLCYSIVFQIMVAGELSTNPPELEEDYQITLEVASRYVSDSKHKLNDVDIQNKKLYLKLDHFLYRADSILKKIKNPKLNYQAKNMIREIELFQSELDKNSLGIRNKYPKDWIKVYLTNLTDFHHRLITIHKEDKKYRPEIPSSL